MKHPRFPSLALLLIAGLLVAAPASAQFSIAVNVSLDHEDFDFWNSHKKAHAASVLATRLVNDLGQIHPQWRFATDAALVNRLDIKIEDGARETMLLELGGESLIGPLTPVLRTASNAFEIRPDLDATVGDAEALLRAELLGDAEIRGLLTAWLRELHTATGQILGPPVEVKIVIDSSQVDDGALYMPNVVLRRWEEPTGAESRLVRDVSRGGFIDRVYVAAGHEGRAKLTRVVLDQNLRKAGELDLCLSRAGGATAAVEADFVCPQLGTCRLDASRPDSAVEACASTGLGWRWPSLVGVARADTHLEVWQSPSLDTLLRRQASGALKSVGFTEFELRAPRIAAPGADAFTYEIRANGVPVWIDGWNPEKRQIPLDPDAPFRLRFALQNPNFRGLYAGCDAVEIALTFYRDGEPTGDSMLLRRPYAALRNAADYPVEVDGGEFEWRAWYRPAIDEHEHQIFLHSVQYDSTLESSGPAPAVERAACNAAPLDEAHAGACIEYWRERFDSLGWRDDQGRPIVGVIRPPLTPQGNKLAFGLSVGVVLPTGQVRFTFAWDELNELARTLVDRASTKTRNAATAKALMPRPRDPDRTQILPKDFYRRTLRGDDRWDARPGVCDSPNDIGTRVANTGSGGSG